MRRDLTGLAVAVVLTGTLTACTEPADHATWRVDVGDDLGTVAVDGHVLVRTAQDTLTVVEAAGGDVRTVDLDPPRDLPQATLDAWGRLGDGVYLEWVDGRDRSAQVLAADGTVRGSLLVPDAPGRAAVHGTLLRWAPGGGRGAVAVLASDGTSWDDLADGGFRSIELRSGDDLVHLDVQDQSALFGDMSGANYGHAQLDGGTALVWTRDSDETWLAKNRPGRRSSTVSPCPGEPGPLVLSPDSSRVGLGRHLLEADGRMTCTPEPVLRLGDDGSTVTGSLSAGPEQGEEPPPVAVVGATTVTREGDDLVGTTAQGPTG